MRTSSIKLPSLRTATVVGCLLLICGASPVEAQICACSPSTYEFTFDFSLTCPRPGGDYPPGIAEVTCFVTSFSAAVQDLVPVSVQGISIIEADLDRVPIAQSAIDGDFVSGDSFTYNSVAALGNSEEIPQSIQLTITGTNAANFSLVQVWAIKFTNDCSIYPVLEVGQNYGWTEFTALGTPQNSVCTAVESGPVPTISPTFNVEPETPAPTPVDTAESTPLATVEGDNPIVGTPAPTGGKGKKTPSPTPLVTEEPTLLPTVSTPAPTIREADEPTSSPTGEPTEAPETDEPTSESTEVPTTNAQENTKPPKGGGKGKGDETPTVRPSTRSPTIQPTIEPTGQTTNEPTKPPKEDDSDDEDLEEPPTDMSFSYYYDLLDEDFEWGRSNKKKKDKKEDPDVREHLRLGGRRRLR